MYKQLVTPNLKTRAQIGMCLEYVQNAYGSGWAGTYALEGWNKINKIKHANHDMPSGVYVPIWFSGMWNGFNYGHVAIYKDGKIYSSPYTNKTTHDTLGSIAEVERIYGMSFIGWSEDIGGTRVIIPAEDDMDIIQNKENWYARCNDTHVRFTSENLARKVFAAYVGKSFLKFVEDVSKTKSAEVALRWQRVGKKAEQENWVKPASDNKKLVQAKKFAQDIIKL